MNTYDYEFSRPPAWQVFVGFETLGVSRKTVVWRIKDSHSAFSVDLWMSVQCLLFELDRTQYLQEIGSDKNCTWWISRFLVISDNGFPASATRKVSSASGLLKPVLWTYFTWSSSHNKPVLHHLITMLINVRSWFRANGIILSFPDNLRNIPFGHAP